MSEPTAAPEPTSGMPRTWRQRLGDVYLTLDARSLGTGRVVLGFMLLLDLLRRLPQFSLWYTNDGLLPNHTLLWQPTYDHALSLFYVASYPTEAAIGFVLCTLAYVMLLVGWRTRLAQVLSLVAVTSLHGRVLFIQNGGDVVLSELALWTAFLPMGRRFSVDAVLAARRHPDGAAAATAGPPVKSIACLAILLQLAVIYAFNALQKTGATWKDGSTVHYVLQVDDQITTIGSWLRPHMTLGLSRMLTWMALAIEHVAPLLVLLPFRTAIARLIAIALLLGLHVGFGLLLNLGLFSASMVAYLPNLLPPEVWVALEKRWNAGRAEFWRDVLAARDRAIARVTDWLRALREMFGMTDTGAASPPTGLVSRLRRRGIILREATVVALLLVAATQLAVENPVIPSGMRAIQPGWAHVVVNGLQLFQGWFMFAPDPPVGDRMLVVDAVTAEGRHVDPFNEVTRPGTRGFAGGRLPQRLGYNSFINMYTDRIADMPSYHGALTDWILRYPDRTGRPGDEIKSFTASLFDDDSPPPGQQTATNLRSTVLVRYPNQPR